MQNFLIKQKRAIAWVGQNSKRIAEFPSKCQKILKIRGAWDIHLTAL